MTREEKQKAIGALKISAPVRVMTQEEFNDYIQTINQVMNWLEQEPILDKVRAEIDKIYEREGNSVDCLSALDELKEFIDKCKAESEVDNG